MQQFGVQFLAVAIVAVYASIITYAILKVLDSLGVLRVSEVVQKEGLDTALYGEQAYNFWNMDRGRPQ